MKIGYDIVYDSLFIYLYIESSVRAARCEGGPLALSGIRGWIGDRYEDPPVGPTSFGFSSKVRTLRIKARLLDVRLAFHSQELGL